MPWWSWVLIWGGLVLALIAMLIVFAVWLFRKAMTTADALEELASKAELLEDRADELRSEPMASSVFTGTVEAARRVAERKQRRAEIRQRRRDLRIKRARLLVKTDPARIPAPIKRT